VFCAGHDAITYDTVTGTASVTSQLSNDLGPSFAAAVGTKALFTPGSDVIDVFDVATNDWSTAPLADARGAFGVTTVGTHAIFAGGGTGFLIEPNHTFEQTVDIFTDTSPAPALSGSINGKARRARTVEVFNTGDADLPAGAVVSLYASSDRMLNDGAALLGQASLTQALAPGASIKVGVHSVLPKNLPAGQYHLVAAVDVGGVLTPIASQAQTFRVSGGGQRGALRLGSIRGDDG
jgi:hypothetical protein